MATTKQETTSQDTAARGAKMMPHQGPNPIRQILNTLREADAKLIKNHPWLGQDDAMALGLFAFGVATMLGCGAAWMMGALPAWLTICGIALGMSILHEMEHDMIHDLYLSNRATRFMVLITIWVTKASLDPWTRGRWHLWHHAMSGQEEDIEERLIGLGTPWGLKRILVTLLPAGTIVLKPGLSRAIQRYVARGEQDPQLLGPPGWWKVHALTAILASSPFVALGGWLAGASWAWPMAALWVLPNMLRHATIAIMSSNSHYTGIQKGALMKQGQILDHPFFWPLQFFCWNFGATHFLHHFFVRQPFWRRTLIFSEVKQKMVVHGIPRNDLQTFARANRRMTTTRA